VAGLNDVRTNLGYTTKSFFVGTYGPFELRRFSSLIAAGFIDWVTNGAGGGLRRNCPGRRTPEGSGHRFVALSDRVACIC